MSWIKDISGSTFSDALRNRELKREIPKIDYWPSIAAARFRYVPVGKTQVLDENLVLPWERIDSDFETRFRLAFNRIRFLESNSIYDFPPNQKACQSAADALELLRHKRLLPPLINATNDESVLFEFFIRESKYSLDFYNSGEIVYLEKSKYGQARVFELDEGELGDAISKIFLAYDL